MMLSCPQELISRQLEAIATTVLLKGGQQTDNYDEQAYCYPSANHTIHSSSFNGNVPMEKQATVLKNETNGHVRQVRHLSLERIFESEEKDYERGLGRNATLARSLKRSMLGNIVPYWMKKLSKVNEDENTTDSNGNVWVADDADVDDFNDNTEQSHQVAKFRFSKPFKSASTTAARRKPRLIRCNTEPDNLIKRRDALLPDWRHNSTPSPAEGIKNIKNEFNPLIKRSTVKRKMKRSRLVRKDGDCNVYSTNVPKKEKQYLRDIFTTLIDAKWRWILLAFSAIFMSSWSTFGVVYFVICFIHGDLDLPDLSYALESDNRTEACIERVDSPLAAFLFSVETQHTIGYGHRYITTACPWAACIVCMQSLCGLLIQSFMVGLVFAKLARPKKRAETLIFSEKAVVTLRDGKLCFCFRVADMRASHLVEAHLRVQMITQRTTDEGEVEPLYQHDLNVGYDLGIDRIFLVWPLTISHEINVDSPLYEYSARQLPTAQFEIVVLLEGIVESTGMTAQARTSYLPSEVAWGHRYEKLVTYQKYNGSYQIDYSLFHNTYPVNTPRCCAKDWDSIKSAGLSAKKSEAFFYKPQDEADIEANVSTDEMTPIPSPRPPSTSNSSQMIIREEEHDDSIHSSSSSTLLAVKDGLWKTRLHSTITKSPSRSRFFIQTGTGGDTGSNEMPEIVVNSPPRTPSKSRTILPSSSVVDPRQQITIDCGNSTSNF